MPLTEKDIRFLAYNYSQYYQTRFKDELYLTDFDSREFAMESWLTDSVRPAFQRHLGFRSIDRFIQILKDDVPRHLYVSAAHYENPSEPSMPQKEWKGDAINCDLIFDIDIDHIYTPCKLEHDHWVCTACGAAGRGPAPEICPNIRCSARAFREIKWECPKCMEVAKQQISYLAEDFMANDFGIDLKNSNETFFTFSGRRGYHLHIEEKLVRPITTLGRREIVDYISGTGLDIHALGINSRALKKPSKTDHGWLGRVTCLTLQYLQNASPEELRRIIHTAPNIEVLRQTMIRDLNSDIPKWRYEGVGSRTLTTLIETAIQKYVPQIDKPVTMDVHRLIRLAGSLHGKTGFLVKKLSFNELQTFDPFADAQVFQGEVSVAIKEAPQFTLQGVDYGPYHDQVVLLPLNAAIYLISREVATVSR